MGSLIHQGQCEPAVDLPFDCFIPWGKILQFFVTHPVSGTDVQEVVEIVVAIHSILFRSLDDAIDKLTGCGAVRRITEQPVLPPDYGLIIRSDALLEKLQQPSSR